MERMPEAEVSLRLAIWLVESNLVDSRVEIAIDGAQVRTKEIVHANPEEILSCAGWLKSSTEEGWRGTYSKAGELASLRLHSKPGIGDVVATLKGGSRLRVESKKGPLSRSRSSQEYPLLREAIGQLMTYEDVKDEDLLAVAVPHSPKFCELANRWRGAPLIARVGILILTVDRDGSVHGFQDRSESL